ncbi:MAG: hypothetical protein DDT40_01691 [candidate division WS2 bacterium]|nr:hypothetical protein [Candidatus Psychracetigena formicireducens]
MRKCILFLSVFLILGGFRAFLQAEEKIYPCYRLTIEPVLDGKIRDDIAWKNIPQETGFVKLGSDSLASKQTFFRMAYSSEALYIGIECEEPEMKKIKAELKDMGDLWTEDSIEIFLFPRGADNYFQFVVNTIGSRWSYEYVQVLVRGPKIPLGNWQAKTYKGKDYYSVEIRIPFEIFGKIPGNKEEWTGNICRNILTSGDRHTTWAHLKRGFHQPDNFGWILFAGKFSAEETRKARDRIIDILKKEIVANLKSLPLCKKEISKEVKKYPFLRNVVASFLKNYEEIENEISQIQNEISQLDTVEKANILLKRSKNLLEEADKRSKNLLEETDKLKAKILLQTLFD